MEDAVGGCQAIIDVRGGGPLGEARIKPHPIGEPIEAGSGGGGITVEIGDPFGHITHLGVGVTVLINKTTINSEVKADVIDAIKDGVDGVLGEQCGVATIILNEVITGFDAVFVIPMQVDKCGESIGIAADPAVDPQHLRFAETSGVRVGGASLVEGVDAIDNQGVEAIGSLSTTLDLGPGDRGGEPRIGHDCLDEAVQTGVGAGEIGFEGC